MDVDDIRLIIRKSLKTKLDEASKKLIDPPQNFEDFRHQFAIELSRSGADQNIVDEAHDCEYKSGQLFDEMWNAWRDLLPEIRSLKTLRASEAQSEWAYLKETYIRNVVNRNLT